MKYILCTRTHEGLCKPIIYNTLEEAQERLKYDYEQDLQDAEKCEFISIDDFDHKNGMYYLLKCEDYNMNYEYEEVIFEVKE